MYNLINLIHFWKPVVEIIILWLIIYHVMVFFEGTRAIMVLRGLTVLVVAFFLFQLFNFQVLDWLLTKLFGISVIAILVIFHTEIRQGLARLGQRHFIATAMREEEWTEVLGAIMEAADDLIKNKIGALIAIEKTNPLTPYIESGVLVDAHISSELIQAIFTPNNPLHDGGLVIRHDRIMAAGCIFPLSDNQELSRIFGTRHRAALGLSEEVDAMIIVVSEERRDISLVYRGKLFKDLGRQEMFAKIKDIVKVQKQDAKRETKPSF